MFKILTLNNIALGGLRRLPRQLYEVASEILHPDAVIVRSQNMHDMEIPETVAAIGRAGAGVNNIPISIMSERGESFVQMMLRMVGSALAMQNAKGRSSDTDLLFAFFASDRALRLKRVMSTQFQDLDGTMSAIEGPNGSTIIGQRNNKALAVLRKEMAKGRKRIGIFYGAGHMPDMEKKLVDAFGLYPDKTSVKWLTAWDMKGK